MPGEGEVYNLGVIWASHAYPANWMVGRSWATIIVGVEMDVRNSNQNKAMIV